MGLRSARSKRSSASTKVDRAQSASPDAADSVVVHHQVSVSSRSVRMRAGASARARGRLRAEEVDAAMADDKQIFLLAQRSADVDDPEQKDLVFRDRLFWLSMAAIAAAQIGIMIWLS